MLKPLSGGHVSDERLRPLTNEVGSAEAKRQQQEAKALVQEAVNRQELRTQRESSAQRTKQDVPEGMQAGLDGGWLPSREQTGGRARVE